MWPSFVDMSKDDCRKAIRAMELETYGGMVDVLRAQGHFSPEKKRLLSDVAAALSIPLERHKAEIRRAVNDDTLNSIAEMLVGPNTATEWAIEGRRHIPLLPRPPQNSILTALADETADYVSTERDVLFSTYECTQRAAEVPYTVEPASPEPSKTQAGAASPSGLIVLPSGAALQMKREPEEEELERKKRKMPVNDGGSLVLSPSSSPPTKMSSQVQQIPMTSRTMPYPPGSTPLKIALPTSGNRTPTSSVQSFTSTPKVIIVSSSGSPNTSSILQKTLSVPMKATSAKPTVMYTASPTTNATDSFKPRVKPLTAASIAKPRPNAIVMTQKPQLKSAMTPVKHPMAVNTKILVQQKSMPRTIQKPQHMVVQQKPMKQTVVTNVQLKTPQGFANVPVQLRAGAKPPTMQLKQDSGGQMKMLSISGGAKILPKPSQPVYVVTASTTPLTMVTRTVPASCPPRVMTVSTGSQGGMKWNQTPLSSKPLQTVHMMTQPRRHDSVVLLQKGSAGKSLVTHTPKEAAVAKALPKSSQKPATSVSSSSFAQSLHQLPQTAAGSNVFLVDLSNQEKMANNPMLADILHASGILEGDSKAVAIDVGPHNEDVDDLEGKDEKDDSKEESATVTSLSIEEAVEMLNRSDTPETRALLSQAGIQISDEIADSEEEEQILDSSPISEPTISNNKEDAPLLKSEALEESAISSTTCTADISVTKELPVVISTPTSSSVHTISTRPRSLDIFTKALASANINLDSFMEEEDDADASTEEKEDPKRIVKEESADSSVDPLDLQLAALTGEMGH